MVNSRTPWPLVTRPPIAMDLPAVAERSCPLCVRCLGRECLSHRHLADISSNRNHQRGCGGAVSRPGGGFEEEEQKETNQIIIEIFPVNTWPALPPWPIVLLRFGITLSKFNEPTISLLQDTCL